MPMFRKRTTIEARPFMGSPDADLERWLGDAFESWVPSRAKLVIRSMGVEMTAHAGDWLVRGAHGVYPCPPDVFMATHEPAE